MISLGQAAMNGIAGFTGNLVQSDGEKDRPEFAGSYGLGIAVAPASARLFGVISARSEGHLLPDDHPRGSGYSSTSSARRRPVRLRRAQPVANPGLLGEPARRAEPLSTRRCRRDRRLPADALPDPDAVGLTLRESEQLRRDGRLRSALFTCHCLRRGPSSPLAGVLADCTRSRPGRAEWARRSTS